MSDSILTSVKKVLGVGADYNVFDTDIIIHTNSAFATLNQLGIGPESGFAIEDDSATWGDFLGEDKNLNPVKTYVYLRVRMLFDPPGTAYLNTAIKDQVKELEWRLNSYRETQPYDTTLTVYDGGSP